MIRFVVRSLLFLSSYIPLFVILTILTWPTNILLAITISVVGIGALLAMLVFFFVMVQRLSPDYATITHVERLDNEIMGYVATYIVPFVTVPFNDWYKGAAFLVLFATIGILYINSNMIHVNPMLSLLRLRIYAVTLDNGQEIQVVITRSLVHMGDRLRLCRASDGIYMEKHH